MMKNALGSVNRLRVYVAASFSLALALLAGCGMGTASAPADVHDAAISGIVHGGQQAVGNSNIALFATTSSGYGGTLTPLATTTTSSSASGGTFSIGTPGNPTPYTCPSGQQAYIVATGGDPGIGGSTDNSAIFLMAALGPCTGLTTSTQVVINEVTTVAAAYALSGFAPAGGAGMTEAAVEADSAMPGFTTSSTNTQGLTDGFANAANIVSSTTGTAYTTPGGTGSGVVPQSTINALADILQDCVNSNGSTASGTPCNNLFTAATPPGGSAPVNVFQAALDIAQNPGNNVSALFNLISAQAAFPTSATTAPNDWTVGVTYLSSQIASGLALGIDKNDNVYISGSTNANLIEFSPQGALLSPTGGWLTASAGTNLTSAAHNPRYIAFDNVGLGNIWLTDGAVADVIEYTPAGTATSPTQGTDQLRTYTSDTNHNNYAIAIDQDNDVWTATYKSSTCSGTTGSSACDVVELAAGAGTPYTSFIAFSTFNDETPGSGTGGSRGLAYDVNTGDVWTTDIDENTAQLFKTTASSSGVATASAAPTSFTLGTEASSVTTNQYGSVAVAVDKSANAWFVVQGGPTTTGTTATAAVPAGLYEVNTSGAVQSSNTVTGGGLSSPAYLAIDGNDNIFVANTGANTIVEATPGTTTPVSPSSGFYLTNTSLTATATATESGGVVQNTVVITSGGSGYGGLTPTVTITGGGGSGATATAAVENGAVFSVTVTAGGSGYTSNPTVTLSAPVANATATATVSGGAVTGFTIVSGGAGYAGVAPTVTIGGPGTGAIATAIVTNGVVSAITLGSGGTGYTTAPTVTLSPSSGTYNSVYKPAYVEVDRSGSIWTFGTGAGTGGTSQANLVQILGVAAPTDPVLVDGKYGVKP